MKTTSFSEVNVTYCDDSTDITMEMRVPGEGSLSTKMTPEELWMFIIELGNGLTASRRTELIQLQHRDLEREQRRTE